MSEVIQGAEFSAMQKSQKEEMHRNSSKIKKEDKLTLSDIVG